MKQPSFTLFKTPVGRCAIVWNEHGIAGLQLPEEKVLATRARIAERFPGASESPPPSSVKEAINAIVALLEGRPSDLKSIALDLRSVPPFHRKVYEAARSVAPGSTLSYGELAERIGSPGAARAVGQALARNPFAIIVPCHRVLAAGGRLGGFTANGGLTTKTRLLSLEGTDLPQRSSRPNPELLF
jgi:methylated-DNA-[protein]-cysteine S-methyltransferase